MDNEELNIQELTEAEIDNVSGAGYGIGLRFKCTAEHKCS